MHKINANPMRSHPLTVAGRFATFPATLHIPRETFVDPITTLLSSSSSKHRTEVAEQLFGGPGLPFSPATPVSKRHLRQKIIGLDASQGNMKPIEGNVFLAAVMPGVYASITSTLVEVRKRLGAKWISDLLSTEGGPRVLDAGTGGVGILAWREIVKAECGVKYGAEPTPELMPPSKSTVVVGSLALRQRVSSLLENTTFLPRLPDHVHVSSAETLDGRSTTQRTPYDVVIAAHTLWPLTRPYERKLQVEKLWSLLDPDGGVLIILEKGLPGGFEAVAGARQRLLEKYISPSVFAEDEIGRPITSDGQQSGGMIIAPCTNHAACPMYQSSKQRAGSKDFCHFAQRFIRPPFLQEMVGAKERNHEDVQFSYIAVRRGKDERDTGLVQGEAATVAAFVGHLKGKPARDDPADESQRKVLKRPSRIPVIRPLSLPRAILPPLKRSGHVILDVCTPSGRLERWTVPKSSGKEAYHDARKAKWGDLWALGAKVRVQRRAVFGVEKSDDNNEQDEEDEDKDERKGPRRKTATSTIDPLRGDDGDDDHDDSRKKLNVQYLVDHKPRNGKAGKDRRAREAAKRIRFVGSEREEGFRAGMYNQSI